MSEEMNRAAKAAADEVRAALENLTHVQRIRLLSMAAFLMPAVEHEEVSCMLVLASQSDEDTLSISVSTYNADPTQSLHIAKGALEAIVANYTPPQAGGGMVQ